MVDVARRVCTKCGNDMGKMRRVWRCEPCGTYAFEDEVVQLMEREGRTDWLRR